MIIEPTAEFVLKGFEHTGEKIFVNIVSHPIIDEPEEKQFVDYENQ